MLAPKEIWIVGPSERESCDLRATLELRYRVRLFTTFTELAQALTSPSADLLLLDSRSQDKTVFQFLAGHEEASLPPFIVMASSEDDADVLRACLARGASDFLSTLFSKAELLTRVERALSSPNHILSAKASTMRATHCGKKSALLTAKEFQILSALISSPARRLNRQQILDSVWSEVRVVPKTFDVHLSNLRRKLSPIGVRVLFQAPGEYSLLTDSGEMSAVLPSNCPSDHAVSAWRVR